MSELLFHPTTQASLQRCINRPPHAMLLVAPAGSGKASTARYLAAGILALDKAGYEKYPYITVISPKDGKAIPIESIRELQHFMALRIPGQRDVGRLVIIEDAQLMTREAQNALLKTLEEPPEGTVLILTATSTEALLPTIQSRVSLLQLVPPAP
ncbi:MAG: dnaX 1, partial [Candidatus Saccharibacteria bacterium]|nr:dnaX 1 [Candidatus Saccharibacteria bacterium]